jgi:outer membrane beta-barrel protein
MNKKLNLILLSLLMVIGLCVDMNAAMADDDYNFSWLDPEKKIYVLQNRKFKKSGGAQIFVLGGMGLGETYRKAFQYQPRIGYWFNEDFGLEAFYTGRSNSENGAYGSLSRALGAGTSPYIREINNQFGVLFNWAPWYAKINVFNSILYFDWYFSMGAGSMGTQVGEKTKETAALSKPWVTENLFAVYLGTGHIFHLSERFMVRLDFLAHFYSAAIDGGNTATGASNDKAIFSNTSLNLGIGLKL